MIQQKVQLYKIRDFGAKINVTIEYIRKNFLPLIKIVLLIVAPVGLLFGILFSNLFTTMFQATIYQDITPDSMDLLGKIGFNYLLMMLLSTVTFALLFSVTYGYMKMVDTQEDRPAPAEVFQKILPKLPMLIVLMVLISVLTFIGFFIFVIPGIYLMVTLSLSIPIFLFEDEGIGTAFSKSFKLVNDKWWSTFGLIIVTGLIASVVSYIFIIPFYALMIGGMFTSLNDGNDPQAALLIFTSWYSVVGMSIMMIGTYITYLIPIIALAFQYFNLSERVEGRGLRNQIKDFETV